MIEKTTGKAQIFYPISRIDLFFPRWGCGNALLKSAQKLNNRLEYSLCKEKNKRKAKLPPLVSHHNGLTIFHIGNF